VPFSRIATREGTRTRIGQAPEVAIQQGEFDPIKSNHAGVKCLL
jgi:hypothetical protein